MEKAKGKERGKEEEAVQRKGREESREAIAERVANLRAHKKEKKNGESRRLAQEGRRWTIGPFGVARYVWHTKWKDNK